MLNTTDIISRIQQLIQEHELNASSFAERIGVQRSSMSHILSGRNKPSLDFLAKIEAAFEDVSYSWLLKGEDSESIEELPLPPALPNINESSLPPTIIDKIKDDRSDASVLHKIIHYYSDGTFEVFKKR